MRPLRTAIRNGPKIKYNMKGLTKMKPKTSFGVSWPFIDLENYIYLNTTLTRKECGSIASDCWRRGLTKEQALNIAKEKQAD